MFNHSINWLQVWNLCQYIALLLIPRRSSKTMPSSSCKAKQFTLQDIPDLSGRTVLVTGATGGLGFETGLALASAGAMVLIGGRNEGKGKDAVDKVTESVPSSQGRVSFAMIDHCSLASIRNFTDGFNAKGIALGKTLSSKNYASF